MSDGAGILVLLFWGVALIVSFLIYFLPSIIVVMNDHRSGCSVMVVNLFFGWSLIGWVIAIAWALSPPSDPTVVVQHQAAPQPMQCLKCKGWNVAILPDGSRVCGSCGQRG